MHANYQCQVIISIVILHGLSNTEESNQKTAAKRVKVSALALAAGDEVIGCLYLMDRTDLLATKNLFFFFFAL